MLAAISADVSAWGAGRAAQIRSSFAVRIDAARRSGGSAAQIAGLIISLKRECQASLKALSDELATERSGRVAAALLRRGRGGQRRQHGFDHQVRGMSARTRPGHGAATSASFKVAAKAVSAPAPIAPRARRRRGSAGRGDFQIMARKLAFRAPRLPAHAYGPELAYLADTLDWLNLWNNSAVDSNGTMFENNTPSQISYHL